MFDLLKSQSQMITFVMVDAAGVEQPAIGVNFSLWLAKNGGAFAPSAGAKTEMGNGWYGYLLTVDETDTSGPLSIAVTAAGCVQQNLEYVVTDRLSGAVDFTYTLTDTVTALPIAGAAIYITTDINGANSIWVGITDASGIARDHIASLPRLTPGTYYFWRSKIGYFFADPDVEVV